MGSIQLVMRAGDGLTGVADPWRGGHAEGYQDTDRRLTASRRRLLLAAGIIYYISTFGLPAALGRGPNGLSTARIKDNSTATSERPVQTAFRPELNRID